MSDTDTARQAARQAALAYLERAPDPVLDILRLLAHAIEEQQRYVVAIEVPHRSTAHVTNIDEARQLARFHERFARRARQEAAK